MVTHIVIKKQQVEKIVRKQVMWIEILYCRPTLFSWKSEYENGFSGIPECGGNERTYAGKMERKSPEE